MAFFLHNIHCVAAIEKISVFWKGPGARNKIHLLPVAYELYRVFSSNRSHRPQTHKGLLSYVCWGLTGFPVKGSIVTQQSKTKDRGKSISRILGAGKMAQ